MRSLMMVLRNSQNNSAIISHIGRFSRVFSLLAVASVLALAPAFAKDPPVKDAKAGARQPAIQVPNHEQVVIPDCLESLKLSAPQETKIKEIIGSYDESLSAVWKQFGERYLQTITLESQMLAAIEDNLTESQREQVRNQRHKTAKYEKSIEATNTRLNQATSKPANAVEDELAGKGVSLTPEQEAAADKIEEKYRSQLRSLNRDIQGLHARLLSLEADKLVEIEKVLTKEQLAELRTHRQSAPPTKLAVTRN